MMQKAARMSLNVLVPIRHVKIIRFAVLASIITASRVICPVVLDPQSKIIGDINAEKN